MACGGRTASRRCRRRCVARPADIDHRPGPCPVACATAGLWRGSGTTGRHRPPPGSRLPPFSTDLADRIRLSGQFDLPGTFPAAEDQRGTRSPRLAVRIAAGFGLRPDGPRQARLSRELRARTAEAAHRALRGLYSAVPGRAKPAQRTARPRRRLLLPGRAARAAAAASAGPDVPHLHARVGNHAGQGGPRHAISRRRRCGGPPHPISRGSNSGYRASAVGTRPSDTDHARTAARRRNSKRIGAIQQPSSSCERDQYSGRPGCRLHRRQTLGWQALDPIRHRGRGMRWHNDPAGAARFRHHITGAAAHGRPAQHQTEPVLSPTIRPGDSRSAAAGHCRGHRPRRRSGLEASRHRSVQPQRHDPDRLARHRIARRDGVAGRSGWPDHFVSARDVSG